MGKLVPSLIISTLIMVASSCLLPETAVYASEYNAEWGELWTIDEARDFYYEVEAEKEATCGDNLDCLRFYYYDLPMDNPRNAIAEIYRMTSFMITAVNPTENTLRAYFRDNDFMAMEMDGEDVHYPMTELYIIWLDSSYDNYGVSYITAMRGDFLVDGMHPLYKATSELNGENWFPVEEEIEIVAPEGANLIDNESGRIDFYARFYPSSVLGGNNYSSCLQSASYEPGMECRVMFKNDGSYFYIPYRKVIDNSNTIPVDNIVGQTDSPDNDESLVDELEQDQTINIIPEEKTPIAPFTPETGQALKEEGNQIKNPTKTNYPWGPIMAIIVCSVPVIWFLLPNRQKYQKISKKSLDKKLQTR